MVNHHQNKKYLILAGSLFFASVAMQSCLDYDDPGVQSKACYDVAVKHGKKVIVMEPVKGGALVNLPDSAKKIFDELNGGSYASYAIRFAASFEGIKMVLSGMGNMNMMRDNLSYMEEKKTKSGINYLNYQKRNKV